MDNDRVIWVSGGGQAGYYGCSHQGCGRKARNVDNWGRSPDLLFDDHMCCGRSLHDGNHEYREREREQADRFARGRASTNRARARGRSEPEGLVHVLVSSVVRRLLGIRR